MVVNSKFHYLGKDFVWSMPALAWGVSVPRGRSSACEQKKNCPTLTL